MKASKLREQTGEELQTLYRELSRELLDLKVKGSVGEASRQPVRRRLLKRDMARILTIMKERGVTIHG